MHFKKTQQLYINIIEVLGLFIEIYDNDKPELLVLLELLEQLELLEVHELLERNDQLEQLDELDQLELLWNGNEYIVELLLIYIEM
jgi:hypothetical protein